MFKLILMVMACVGCGAADEAVLVFGEPVQNDPDSFYAEPSTEPVAVPVPPLTMYVAPEDNDDLILLTLRTIERVRARTGAVIEVRDGGIPITLGDPGGGANGRTLTDKWCFGGGCDAAHGTRIILVPEMLARIYFDNFADNSLAHEFAHILSGWGQCSDEDVDGHLEPGHIISNGNEHYGQMSWTDADTRLTCSCGACP